MWRHYVYIHFKASDGMPFYVGKGSHRAKDKIHNYNRARETHSNNHWKNIVNKHGIIINVIANCKTDEEAQRLEKEIIAIIGRENLVNLTDGSESFCGLTISDELRKKRSIAASGFRSEAWISAIRVARKNDGNGGVVKRDDKLPQSWRDNLALAKLSDKNPNYGKITKVARKVIDDFTKQVYPSVGKAVDNYNLKMKTLYNMLSGHRTNNTSLRFYNGM